jgi:hypothetical protein
MVLAFITVLIISEVPRLRAIGKCLTDQLKDGRMGLHKYYVTRV